MFSVFHVDRIFKNCLDYFLILFRDACSEGMNGYISPCTGEPCPPVFRSPVESMEDIMDNQVMYVFKMKSLFAIFCGLTYKDFPSFLIL